MGGGGGARFAGCEFAQIIQKDLFWINTYKLFPYNYLIN